MHVTTSEELTEAMRNWANEHDLKKRKELWEKYVCARDNISPHEMQERQHRVVQEAKKLLYLTRNGQ